LVVVLRDRPRAPWFLRALLWLFPTVGPLGWWVSISGDAGVRTLSFLALNLLVSSIVAFLLLRWLDSVEYILTDDELSARFGRSERVLPLSEIRSVRFTHFAVGEIGVEAMANRQWNGLMVTPVEGRRIFIAPSDPAVLSELLVERLTHD